MRISYLPAHTYESKQDSRTELLTVAGPLELTDNVSSSGARLPDL